MNIAQELENVAASLDRLAVALVNDGDPVGSQVAEDNAGRLRALIAEQAEAERERNDFRQVLLVAREVFEEVGEVPPTVRVVRVRQMIETVLYGGEPAPTTERK